MVKRLRQYKKITAAGVIALFVVLSSHTSLLKEKEKEEARFHTAHQEHLFRMMNPIQAGEYFLGSITCKGCHGKDVLQGIANVDANGNDVNLYDDWQATMMSLSAKDPLWRAQVSREVHTNPTHGAALQNKCTSCHAPMGHYSALFKGEAPYLMSDLDNDTLGLDGVSCVSCHMQGPNAGSAFSGQIQYDTTLKLYGPFLNPEIGPMQLYTGFIPTYGAHMSTSNACASCHTLVTDVVDLSGNYTGGKFVEQSTFHEWKNSTYPSLNKNCQSCHMPQIRGPVIIANNIKALQPRTPFNLHKFMGGNSFMLQLMKDNKAALDITAEDVNFDSSIANTIHLLQNATLDMNIDFNGWLSDTVASFSLKLTNLAGHKFPSGYPSRRAFVQFVATTLEGDTIFKSGMMDPNFEVIGHDAVTEPHHQVITDQNQVQIYEMVMADVAGNRTTLLERANTKIKDNRLVPLGYSSSSPLYDTISIVGIGTDSDFNNEGGTEGSGTDRVNYQIRVPGGHTLTGSINVYAKVFYQVVPPRWVADMFAISTPEIDLFEGMYNAADRRPVEVASAQMMFVLTPNSSVEEAGNAPAIILGPNPTVDGFLNITAGAGVDIRSIEVFESNGKLIEAFRNPDAKNWQYLLKGAAGQYIIRVETNTGFYVKRVIKL